MIKNETAVLVGPRQSSVYDHQETMQIANWNNYKERGSCQLEERLVDIGL